MIPALNLGSGYLPSGLRAEDLPYDDEADEPQEECLHCGMTPCIGDEGIDDLDEGVEA